VSLSVSDLLTIDRIPTIQELSLRTIAEFYEQHLMNRQFRYQIAHREEEIRVRFEPWALSHLLAIHHFVPGLAGKSRQGHYSLMDETITFEKLMSMNQGQFETDKLRMLCFPFVHQIIQNPKLQEADQNDEVRAQWILYDNSVVKYVQLKLRRREPKSKFYVPVTLLVHSKLPPKKQIRVKSMEELDLDQGLK
jgi:hypothetical protein